MRYKALFTDLYKLTMAQAYHAKGMEQLAAFELAFRQLPRNRNFIVATGFADVLDFLTGLRFTDDDLGYLRRRGEFSDEFLKRLASLRFSGDVYAVPEGTAVSPNEPLLQVFAPIIEAQLVETFVLNQIHFQSIAATKAARVVAAAQGRAVKTPPRFAPHPHFRTLRQTPTTLICESVPSTGWARRIRLRRLCIVPRLCLVWSCREPEVRQRGARFAQTGS